MDKRALPQEEKMTEDAFMKTVHEAAFIAEKWLLLLGCQEKDFSPWIDVAHKAMAPSDFVPHMEKVSKQAGEKTDDKSMGEDATVSAPKASLVGPKPDVDEKYDFTQEMVDKDEITLEQLCEAVKL